MKDDKAAWSRPSERPGRFGGRIAGAAAVLAIAVATVLRLGDGQEGDPAPPGTITVEQEPDASRSEERAHREVAEDAAASSVSERLVRGWQPLPDAPISARSHHSAVWADDELLLWGGTDRAREAQSDGAAYDPMTRSWRQIPEAPIEGVALYTLPAVWTGEEMLVWGGQGEERHAADPVAPAGAAYDPVDDSWRTLSPAPLTPRVAHTSVWTGEQMIVWGGYRRGEDGTWLAFEDGAAYEPQTDTWRMLEPAPLSARHTHTAIWTGRKMIIWAGNAASREEGGEPRDHLDGAAYDPARGTWDEIAELSSGLRPPRVARRPVAVWTGHEMVVVGSLGDGLDAPAVVSYEPAADRWVELDPGPVGARRDSAVVWTGDLVVVWGGTSATGGLISDGAAYAPESERWHRIASQPAIRGESVTWIGDELVLWGGYEDGRRAAMGLALPSSRLPSTEGSDTPPRPDKEQP